MPQEGTISILGHSDVTDPIGAQLPGNCQGANEILSRIGDKWSVLTIMLLADRPRRFNELKRMIGGISQRMLTLTLRGLERDGLVSRTMIPTSPPRVDYELTELGHSLKAPVAALGTWAFKNLGAVRQARSDFDHRAQEVERG
jgi:DNA-binding HxlR family transcriptional regulator